MKKIKLLFFVLTLILLLPACGTQSVVVSGLPSSSEAASSAEQSSVSSTAVSSASSSNEPASSASASSTSASNTPSSSTPASSAQSVVSRLLTSSSKTIQMSSSLPPAAAPKKAQPAPMPAVTAKMPQASETDVFSKNSATVDYSNAAQGYIMVKYSGSANIKVLVYFNGGSSYYQYNISGNGVYVTLPLQSGSGFYKVRFMENVGGNSYAELCATELNALVTGSGYTLYPNQYVNYTRSSAAVSKAKSLCAKATNNTEKVNAIYKFIASTIRYDYDKASSVKSGYLPNVDSTLSSKKGICFDYAALMATMLRSQGIPTKLVIGNTTAGYHAWNEVYISSWKRYDATFAAAGQTAGSYTPEKYY